MLLQKYAFRHENPAQYYPSAGVTLLFDFFALVSMNMSNFEKLITNA